MSLDLIKKDPERSHSKKVCECYARFLIVKYIIIIKQTVNVHGCNVYM